MNGGSNCTLYSTSGWMEEVEYKVQLLPPSGCRVQGTLSFLACNRLPQSAMSVVDLKKCEIETCTAFVARPGKPGPQPKK